MPNQPSPLRSMLLRARPSAVLRALSGGAESAEPPLPPASLNVGLLVILALGAVCLMFFDLGEHRTLGRHEAYAVVPAREMLRTGDWIVPRFAGVPRLEKPPLAYWLVASSARMLGRLDEFTSRVPAALSALALAALVGVWAGRWYGKMAGVGSAVATVSSVFVVTYGRRAEVDMFLCLVTTTALFLVADQPANESGPRTFLRWTGIYACLAIAWLGKFHYAATMVLAPAVIYHALQGRFRVWLHMINPVGAAMMTVAIFLWPSLLLERVPDAARVWQEETVGRAVGSLGRQPVWFYFPHLLSLPLPWTPLALIAIVPSWRRAWTAASDLIVSLVRRQSPLLASFSGWRDATRRDDARERFLWVCVAVQVAILSASAGKHQHYLAASMPALWLLIGQGFATAIEAFRTGRFAVNAKMATGATVAMALSAAAVISVMDRRWSELEAASIAIPACIALGGAIVAWLFHTGDYIPGCYVLTGAFVGVQLFVSGEILPAEDRRSTEIVRFARIARAEAGERETLWAYGMGAHAALYYTGEPVERAEAPHHIIEALDERRSLKVITLESRMQELCDFAAVRVLRRPEFSQDDPPKRIEALVLIELTCRDDIARSPSRLRNASRRTDAFH